MLFIMKKNARRFFSGMFLFIVLACSQLFHSFNCRNMTESIFKLGFFSNSKLVFANMRSFLLQMSVVYVPFLRAAFKTEPLDMLEWTVVVVISSFPLWAMEGMKMIVKRRESVIIN